MIGTVWTTIRPRQRSTLGTAMPDAMDRHADAETRERLTRDPLMTRRGGWWGIAFVLAIAVVAGAVSLPTAKSSGDYIRAFYAAHAQLIIVQQILEILALVLFVGFVVALQRRLGGGRWLLAAAALVVAGVRRWAPTYRR